MKKIIKDEVSYLIFNELYLKLESPKSKRKAFMILEGTVQCLAKKGFDRLTLEMIAREVGTTRQVIKYYFKGVDEVQEMAIKYVRLLFQKLAVDAVLKESSEDRALARYVETCFSRVDNFRTHAILWSQFLNLCAYDSKRRALNTEAVIAGEERIRSLIERGGSRGVFAPGDSEQAAKLMQVLVTGAMITYAGENLKAPKAFVAMIREQCLALAGSRLSAETVE